MPWSRKEDGRIDQRNFGGYSFQEQLMHLTKLVSLKCKLCMTLVKNLKILNISMNGLQHQSFMMENDSWD